MMRNDSIAVICSKQHLFTNINKRSNESKGLSVVPQDYISPHIMRDWGNSTTDHFSVLCAFLEWG